MKTLYVAASLIVMLLGLAGTVLPVLPGIALIYLGYLLYGLFTSWQDYGAGTMVFWGAVTALTLALDYFGAVLGSKRSGSSIFGIWGSFVGAILGMILFNLIGLIVGTFAGAVVGELVSGRSAFDALRSGKGALVGFLAGSLFKVVVGLIMIGYFLWKTALA